MIDLAHPPTAVWKEIVNSSYERLDCMINSGVEGWLSSLFQPPKNEEIWEVSRGCLALHFHRLENPSSAAIKICSLNGFSLAQQLSAHKSMNKRQQYNLELDLRVSNPALCLLICTHVLPSWKLLKEKMVEMCHSMYYSPECWTLMSVRYWFLGFGLQL